MPLYEYECKQCKRHTEKIQKFSDAEITECPHCGGPLERVISAPAISFKGGGWYADGYSHTNPSSKRDGEGSGGSGGSSASSESAAKPVASAGSDSSSSTPASGSAAPAAAASTPASSSEK
jgi:putative FmdB family regulatory protein